MSLNHIHSHTFSNHTLYGIYSDAVRYLWAGYFVFVLLSSLIGDTTILIASIKYRAFKLHKVVVVIIQHIAVCDLLVLSTTMTFRTISLFCRQMGTWRHTLLHVCLYQVFLQPSQHTVRLHNDNNEAVDGQISSKFQNMVC